MHALLELVSAFLELNRPLFLSLSLTDIQSPFYLPLSWVFVVVTLDRAHCSLQLIKSFLCVLPAFEADKTESLRKPRGCIEHDRRRNDFSEDLEALAQLLVSKVILGEVLHVEVRAALRLLDSVAVSLGDELTDRERLKGFELVVLVLLVHILAIHLFDGGLSCIEGLELNETISATLEVTVDGDLGRDDAAIWLEVLIQFMVSPRSRDALHKQLEGGGLLLSSRAQGGTASRSTVRQCPAPYTLNLRVSHFF